MCEREKSGSGVINRLGKLVAVTQKSFFSKFRVDVR